MIIGVNPKGIRRCIPNIMSRGKVHAITPPLMLTPCMFVFVKTSHIIHNVGIKITNVCALHKDLINCSHYFTVLALNLQQLVFCSQKAPIEVSLLKVVRKNNLQNIIQISHPSAPIPCEIGKFT